MILLLINLINLLMEIVLKRIAKKNSYTIGRLYILKDEEVESGSLFMDEPTVEALVRA